MFGVLAKPGPQQGVVYNEGGALCLLIIGFGKDVDRETVYRMDWSELRVVRAPRACVSFIGRNTYRLHCLFIRLVMAPSVDLQ